jgi:hypothetical protein
VSNWKAERDAFVSETMAFVEAVRSQRPISTEAVVTPRQLPLGVPENFQQPAPTVSEHPHVVSDETAEQPRLEPMMWGGSEREEIRSASQPSRRISNALPENGKIMRYPR